MPHSRLVVINRKTTKFESNSQRSRIKWIHKICCYQSQNYKIWKQFTTTSASLNPLLLLLSIAKLQNLKAIHNLISLIVSLLKVVINRKTTKFESNSQRFISSIRCPRCCYQSQNYKIWKQFTTAAWEPIKKVGLLSIAKLQNLKAIHN